MAGQNENSKLKMVEDELIKIENETEKEIKKLKSVSKIIGPGVVTGASNDDPSGIITYSSAGAQYGFGLNWLTVFAFPMMIAMQEISARIGIVTGKGLAGVLRIYSNKTALYLLVSMLVIANTINIGADLGAMAAVAQLIWDIPVWLYLIFFACILLFLEVFISYKKYAHILKWLTLSLLAYFVTALIVTNSWSDIGRSIIEANFSFDKNYLLIVVGFLGTTISPYLYFWQASEEIEEAVSPSPKQVKLMRMDVFLGTLFSQATAFFIIITTALTLHANGITQIDSAVQAAQALVPLAGQFAALVFAIGIIGTGMLAIPVLAGSGAYAVAESFSWKEGLSLKYRQAKGFYGVIIASTIIGLLMNFIGINPMKALIYAAVVNGIAAVPLIALMVKIGADKKIMGRYTNSWFSNYFGWLTFGVMGLAVILMFWGFWR